MWSRVVAVVAGAALAAGGFALGRATADTHAGHDAGVREGRAAGLQEGRALQATGSSPRGERAAFDAGYAAGANDVFGGFDGGWSLVGALRHHPRPRQRSRDVPHRLAPPGARIAVAQRSGDGRRAHGDGGEEVEQALGDDRVAGDLELGARGVEPEGLHPRALGPLDASVGLGRAALLVAHARVLDVQDVDAGARPVG